jgi:hypothetical protein
MDWQLTIFCKRNYQLEFTCDESPLLCTRWEYSAADIPYYPHFYCFAPLVVDDYLVAACPTAAHSSKVCWSAPIENGPNSTQSPSLRMVRIFIFQLTKFQHSRISRINLSSFELKFIISHASRAIHLFICLIRKKYQSRTH